VNNKFKILGTFFILISLALFTACGNQKAEGEESSDTDSTKTDSSELASDGDSKNKKESDLDSVPVETIRVWRGKMSSYILLSSTIETEQYVNVYPYLTGIVAKLLAEEGDELKKGDPLLRLDAEEYRLAEAKAGTQLKSLQNEFRRLQVQFDKELLSKEVFDKAKFNLEQARISWQETKLNLDRTTVRAPIDGVVSLRNVRQGDRVMASVHLFSMVNLDNIIATVHVPEKELSVIQKGQLTYLTSDYLEDKRFEGNPETGTFKVTIGLDLDHEGLRPGMFVNAFIITRTNDNALILNKDAIVYDGNKRFVFVVKDSLAYKLPVEVGFEDASRIEIIEGISDTANVIIVGQNGLRDKTKVKIVKRRKIS